MIGDILSSWEILANVASDSLLSTRLYLQITYFPVDDTDFMFFEREMFYEILFCLYYGKMFVERYNMIKVWSLAMQIEFGDYEEKPGFIER